MRDALVVSKMLKRFGDSIEVSESGKVTGAFAVIQPLLYKNKMYLNGVNSSAGFYDGGHYLMIAPADLEISDYRSARIMHRGISYRIKRVEIISSAGEDLYIWAVITPCSKEVEDDYEKRNKCA